MAFTEDFLLLPPGASIGEALQAYLDVGAQWWWLLATEKDCEIYGCSYGSLLPYLTGRTPHIVHAAGDCTTCSHVEPRLWRDTGALVEEALADEEVCRQTLWSLSLLFLPRVDAQSADEEEMQRKVEQLGMSACAVRKNGVLWRVYVEKAGRDLGDVPLL